MAIVATLWILSGNFKDDAEHQGQDVIAESSQSDEGLFRVTVKQFKAQELTQRIDLQGEIDADRNVDIRAETEGAIAKLIAKKGDRMTAGQRVLNLAMNDRQARLARAKADLKVARAELKSSLSLKEKNLLKHFLLLLKK